ncbi:MAG TPA: hypothetical protein VL961_08265, partial [Acidimicrobiales bacterium]|nr:hypothetical protein [Acidimicrobiales bacterium]
MGKRNLIPRLQLGVLTVLAGVFALVGVEMVPQTTPSDIVQEATTATFGAQSFVLQLTIGVSAGQNAGMLLQVRRIDFSTP